jgi:hypothetical protein
MKDLEKIKTFTEEEIKKWDIDFLQKKFLELQEVKKTAEIVMTTQKIEMRKKDKIIELMLNDLNTKKSGYSNKEIYNSYQGRAISILKDENQKEVNYLKGVNEERININEKLNNELTHLIRQGEKLINYELWVNEKCEIFIQPMFIIETKTKNMEEEGFAADTVYTIMKKS